MAVDGLDPAILIGDAGIVAGGLHAVAPAKVVVAPGEIKLSVAKPRRFSLRYAVSATKALRYRRAI